MQMKLRCRRCTRRCMHERVFARLRRERQTTSGFSCKFADGEKGSERMATKVPYRLMQKGREGVAAYEMYKWVSMKINYAIILSAVLSFINYRQSTFYRLSGFAASTYKHLFTLLSTTEMK